MITIEEYEKARKAVEENSIIVNQYLHEQKLKIAPAQKEREENCTNHEYEEASYKWGPVNRMQCRNCGKVIND